jgi:malonate-semialdehyde dehydrogenase (acetylating)/methylmalonate-semialdehyde dehydrogenase
MGKGKCAPAQNFINGKFIAPTGSGKIDVISPLDGDIVSSFGLSSTGDLNDAVAAAKEAFTAWSSKTIKSRSQIFYRYRSLVEKHLKELAELIHIEHGKTFDEAVAEIEKGIEVTEFACSLPQTAAGEGLEVSRQVYCHYDRLPLGVVASIAPFNFPFMVPHWTIPIALTLGNCLVLKPSEQVPLTTVRIAELLREAGLPAGVFNVVNGDREIVEAVCDHPDIKAVSFVGSTPVAKVVYKRCTANYKRALCLGGAKNHLFLLPDAHPEMSAANIVASFTGCAGQRCMAASVLLAVGEVDAILQKIVAEAKKIIPGRNMGPVISRAALDRISGYIEGARRDGAVLALDGRRAKIDGDGNGFYIGPTIVDHVKPGMQIARDEVFGPVLTVIRVKNIYEGLKIENEHPYGNAASVFTRDGSLAEKVITGVSSGMVGVNIGVPVPREPFGFGGWNDSSFGAGDITGKSSMHFWTKDKKVTVKWNPESGHDWMS